MSDPFRISGPALISFSGGRTSAYMLHQIVAAHGGVLPPDIVVAFANTGKEHAETLRFVHDCSTQWGVYVHWVEWRSGKPGFEEVGYNSASRNGEPFTALIEQKKRVPNWQERWCTQFLKVLPMFALMRALGFGEPGAYVEAIGLRDDEGLRILAGMARAERDGRKVAYPLAKAKVRRGTVDAFWPGQSFDLALPRGMGNCTHCFAMARAERISRLRFAQDDASWWIDKEQRFGRFDRRDTVAGLLAEAQASPTFFGADDYEPSDAECGLACAGGQS